MLLDGFTGFDEGQHETFVTVIVGYLIVGCSGLSSYLGMLVGIGWSIAGFGDHMCCLV